jgi:hypothetical protein
VTLDDGKTQRVKVNQYLLAGGPQANYKPAGEEAWKKELAKNGLTKRLTVNVGTGVLYIDPPKPAAKGKPPSTEKQVTNTEGVNTAIETTTLNFEVMAKWVFKGKGSPEHCQIVLQLANRWGLAPELQKYADAWLGLDCNGFVGNYLWHTRKGKNWDDLGVRNHDMGPDALISEFLLRNPVKRWRDVDPSKTYVLGLTDSSGVVVPGGPNSKSGHIAITDNTVSKRDQKKDGLLSPAVFVVESTGAHTPGLWGSYYNCKREKGDGLFTLFREEMIAGHQEYDFRIAEIKY